MQTTIWHNPRCSKSRATLQLLEENGVDANVVLYLQTPPSVDEIKQTLNCLSMEAGDIIRKGESAFAENNLKGKDLNNDATIEIMAKNPILIERPIVIKGDKAVIGRPPENVLSLL